MTADAQLSAYSHLQLLSGLTHQDLVVVQRIDCTLANFSQGETGGQTADLSFSCSGNLPACKVLGVRRDADEHACTGLVR